MFDFDACLIIFPKVYNNFRTCISSPIHYYITYKPIQNTLKNVWNSKIIQKTVSGQVGRPVIWSVPMAGQNDRPPSHRAFGQGACTFVHVVGRPNSRSLTLAVDRSVDWLRDPNSRLGSVDRPLIFFFIWTKGRSTGANDSFLDELSVDWSLTDRLTESPPVGYNG